MREIFTAEELAEIRRAYDAVRKPGTFEEGKWSVSHYNRRPDALGKPLRVGAAADPQPGRGQVVLKICRCGICGSDLHMTEDPTFGLTAGVVIGH